MRYERVNALAFGPFRDEKLELAPGMNVIHGLNEAGKSSWHAALYAGLCGMRKARGKPKREDSSFADRHRPWSGDGNWNVGALIRLEESGHRVELRHDLLKKIGSARDADVPGHDYSGQRIYDGAVDGSRWLGLNRQSFRATACVRQGDILGVQESADFLQEALQKAAAGAPRDATAAAAIDSLKSYRKEHVGSPIAPTKPLSRAKAEVANRRAKRDEARDKRDEYQRRQADIDELGEEVAQCREEVAAVRAVLAMQAARTARQHLTRARRLDAIISCAPESPSSSEIAIATRVETALENWNSRPVLTDLPGRSTEVIERDIQKEECRVAAARAVLSTRDAEKVERRLARATELASQFPDGPPRSVAQDDELATSVNEALIVWKNRPRPADLHGLPSDAIRGEIDTENHKLAASCAAAAEHDAEEPERRLTRFILASRMGYLLLLVALLGVAVAALNWLVVPALVLLPWAWWERRKDKRMRKQALGARKRADELLRVADEFYVALAREQNVTAADLPGIRAEHARHGLELRVRLEQRVTAEQQRNTDQEVIRAACRGLARVSTKIGIAGEDAARLATALEEWRQARRNTLAEQGKRRELWGEYQGLLDGTSLDDVTNAAFQARKKASASLNDPLLESPDDTLVRAHKRTSEELSELVRRGRRRLRRLGEERGRRRGPEERRRRDETQIARAQTEVARVAKDAGVVADDPERLALALDEWLSSHRNRSGRADTLQEQKDEYNRLVGERSLSEFDAEVESLNQRAAELAARVDNAALARARTLPPDSSGLKRLEGRLNIAEASSERERGRLDEFGKTLPDIADAEDALAEAKREQERVVRLRKTLDRTIRLLERAQERVFRTIAPVLRSTLLQWLSRVTGGRYNDCRIDPETLQVEVSAARPEAPWRDAGLLSHGTAEQVYLLLRLALSRHLGDQDESCPLILDDPVVSSDASRKYAVLDTLYVISESVQVILFTHEDDVRDWAQERLSGNARHRLVELPAVGR